MILLLDNYDSFTWNIYHFLGELGAEVSVCRNDKISVEEVRAQQPAAIVFSPGPCTPNEAGISLALIAACSGTIPLLGICLGHEAIGQAFGARVVAAPKPVHGKLSQLTHHGKGLFAGLRSGLEVARYHSLVVEESSLPSQLEPSAWSEDGLMMAMHHKEHLTFGVQFHPESIATEQGHQVLDNFLTIAKVKR